MIKHASNTGVALGAAVLLMGLVACNEPVESTDAPPTATDDWREGWSEAPYWGGRIGYIDQAGNLRVQLRYAHEPRFVVVTEDVRDFQLLDRRLAVVKTDGSLWLNEGSLDEPLRKIADDVEVFQLTLNGLGMLGTDGTLQVKRSGFAPQSVARGVKAFQLEGLRTAVLGLDGSLWLQHGPPSAQASHVADGVASVQLERDWVAYESADGTLMLGQWEPRAGLPQFVEQASGWTDYEMEASIVEIGAPSRMHLAGVSRDGMLFVGEGAEAPLRLSPTGKSSVRSVRWAGNMLATQSRDGTIAIASLTPNTTELAWLEAVAQADAFDLNVEGSLLVERAGAMHAIHVKALHSSKAKEMALQELAASNPEADLALPSLPRAGELIAADVAPIRSTTMRSMQVSSIRPRHTRRSVARASAGATATGEAGAILFVSSAVRAESAPL